MGEIVAVTGVTGDVGGKTAELLRAAGVTVRAVVRRPEQVDALRARGIDGRLADLDDHVELRDRDDDEEDDQEDRHRLSLDGRIARLDGQLPGS